MLDLFSHVGDANVVADITLQEWLDIIQYSPDTSDLIESTRNDGTGPDGSIMALKNTLPCVAYNFRFNRYKTNKNIISGTGYLYIDVDIPGFDISVLDTNKIHAYYRSIRLQGYGIIVRVDGLTFENFIATYGFICEDLGLELDYDTCAKKATQFSVLSYDPDMFYNRESFVYTAITSDNQTRIAPLSLVNREREDIYDRKGGKTRFDNTDEICIPEGQDYVENWDDGFEVIKAWLPIKKIADGRYNTILAYANNYVWLNPDVTTESLYNTLQKVNHSICITPIETGRINSIVKSIMQYNAEGTLQPIVYHKKRRIVFKLGVKLTREEKLAIVRYLVGKAKSNQSIERLSQIIRDWDFTTYGKISSRKIAQHHPINHKTVDKYYSLFKEDIDIMNQEYQIAPLSLVNITGEYIYDRKGGKINMQEQKQSQQETLPIESGLTIANNGMKIEAIEKSIIQVIDEFIGAGDLSFDTEIKLMYQMKDAAKEIHALDNSTEADRQFSLFFSYYKDSKFKVAL